MAGLIDTQIRAGESLAPTKLLRRYVLGVGLVQFFGTGLAFTLIALLLGAGGTVAREKCMCDCVDGRRAHCEGRARADARHV